MMEQTQHIMAMQLNKLVESITGDRVALASRSASLPPIPAESASAAEYRNKKSRGPPWFFPGIVDHCLEEQGKAELLLDWNPDK